MLDHEKGRHLLTMRKIEYGVGLIEMMIALAILAILVGIAVPEFRLWLQNARIRTAADGFQNGLQLARSEAVKRNASVRFHLTDTLTSACTTAVNGVNWVVALDAPDGACDTAPSETGDVRILQTRNSAEGSSDVTVNANQASVVFNGLGRVTPVPAASVSIDLASVGGSCKTDGGSLRCLRVVVTAGGQIRMCDPSRGDSDPQGC